VKEVKIGTMALVCFTAASEFSNFPAPARTGKTAHNSHRFHQKTVRVVSGFSGSSREIRKFRRSGKAVLGP